MKSIKNGSKVEILSNFGILLKDKNKPIIGKVISISGYYVLVKPKYCRWVGQWYTNELKLI